MEENKATINPIFRRRIQCLDCDCIGVLREKDNHVYLLPEDVLTTRSIRTQKEDYEKEKTWKKKITAKMSLAKHGNATDRQFYSYLSLGSAFWITVMIIANFYSLEKSRGVTTFLTTTCHRNYKRCVRIASMDFCGHLLKQCYETQEFILPKPVSMIEDARTAPLLFTTEENDVNFRRCQKEQFYDQNVCRHLCSETLVLESKRSNPISPCESMCFDLTRSSKGAGEICPFQKYCSNGCPCPFYDCEKFESRQKLVPVFDLQMGSISNTTINQQIAHAMNTNLYQNHFRKFIGSHQPKNLQSRWIIREDIKKRTFPIILSDLGDTVKRTNVSDSFFQYERFSENLS